jgi:hypothetical protein
VHPEVANDSKFLALGIRYLGLNFGRSSLTQTDLIRMRIAPPVATFTLQSRAVAHIQTTVDHGGHGQFVLTLLATARVTLDGSRKGRICEWINTNGPACTLGL